VDTTKIKRIGDLGQSIWLDFLDRAIMESGKLRELIEQDGVKGVTSNPSIFERAISSSSDYDEDIKALALRKNSAEEIFLRLVVNDIKRASGYFNSVYQKANGIDGFVSLEVSPRLAYDTNGTIKEAKQLWKSVSRNNVMIKIPSTAEGLPAIRHCTGEGININITLLFGLPRYEEVIDAYISGLEDRLKANLPIDQIVSVASFFLSRIDVLIDPLLEAKGLSKLRGEVAIASAKKAYEIFNDVFNGERFKKLAAHGANKQRLLWASTSSKDPSFSDVKYINALIGAETINTIPIETLEAFNDHGKPESHLEDEMDKATNVLEELKNRGIDINNITHQLEREGIEKFNMAYDKLQNAIEKVKEKQNNYKNRV
jgi:transaldolase/transaldolase/glucose-6-phosphate isomerase